METDAIVALATFLALPLGLYLLVRAARRPRRDARLAARVAELEALAVQVERVLMLQDERLNLLDRDLRAVEAQVYGAPLSRVQ